MYAILNKSYVKAFQDFFFQREWKRKEERNRDNFLKLPLRARSSIEKQTLKRERGSEFYLLLCLSIFLLTSQTCICTNTFISTNLLAEYTTTIYMTYYTHQITHNTLKADWWLQGIPLLLPLLIIILLVCSYQPSSHSLSFSSSSSSSEPGATTHTFLVYSKKFQSCWSSSSSFTNTHVT